MINEQIKVIEERKQLLVQQITQCSIELHEALIAKQEFLDSINFIKKGVNNKNNIINIKEIKEKSIQAAKARESLEFVNQIIQDSKKNIGAYQSELSAILRTLENIKGEQSEFKVIDFADYLNERDGV